MSSKLRSALLVALGLSLAVGWFVAGPIMDKTAVGFEENAFPAGAFLQSIFVKLVPGLAWAGAGLALVVAISLAVACTT